MKKFLLKKNINIIDIIIFFIPILFCLFSLYIFFPGIYNYDVFEQLRQINIGDFSNAHPFISTFYIMLFHRFIGIKCALPIFQILWFSILWTKICKYNRKVKSNCLIVFQILFTIFVSFNPMIETTIISNNKDSLFFLVFLTLCFNLQKIIDKNFKTSYISYIVISFLFVLFSNIRHNGYYTNLFFIPLFIILVLIKTYKYNKKIIITLITSLIIFNYIFMIPSQLYNVKNDKATSDSIAVLKALQFDGYLLQENILTEKEKKELARYVELETLYNNVNYTFTDNLVYVKKTNYYNENKSNFIKFNLKLIKEHFKHSLNFYHISSTLVWDIVVKQGSVYNCLWFYINVPNRPNSYYYVNEKTDIFHQVYDTFMNSQNSKIARTLLYSPAFYLYISFIMMLILMIRFKYKKIWIIFVFNFINVLIISFSIPVQDTRYLLNNFALCFLFTIILANKIAIYKSNNQQIYERKKMNNYKKIGSGKLKILLIIPSYNEEKNILSNYKKIQEFNKNSKIKYDAIIINDGSKDQTENICKENNLPYITLIHNLGIGGAVQTGYKYALENDYDIAVQFDGDGQHDVNYVKNIIDPIINNECDMTIGSRFINKSSSKFKSSLGRRIGIKLISFFTRLVSGKKIYDTTSGFRAVNKEVIKKFSNDYPVEYPEPITTVELLKEGYIVKEVPVSMNERKNGVSSIKTWKNVYYMINVMISIIIIGIGGKKNE